MIEQAIYLLLTVIIPLKMTYSSIRQNNNENKKLWAMYWAFFTAFKSLQWNLWFLQYKPFDFLFIVLAIWFYNDSYKGGLFLADFIKEKTGKIPAVANILNTISTSVKFIPLFQTSPVFESTTKPKSE